MADSAGQAKNSRNTNLTSLFVLLRLHDPQNLIRGHPSKYLDFS